MIAGIMRRCRPGSAEQARVEAQMGRAVSGRLMTASLPRAIVSEPAKANVEQDPLCIEMAVNTRLTHPRPSPSAQVGAWLRKTTELCPFFQAARHASALCRLSSTVRFQDERNDLTTYLFP